MSRELLAVEAPPELDDYVQAFEVAQAADGDAGLELFLPEPADPLYLPVLRELVRVDLEFGWQRGRPRPLHDYRSRFPALADDAAGLGEIAFEEYRLRRQAGERPAPAEYRERYGIDTSGWQGPADEPDTSGWQWPADGSERKAASARREASCSGGRAARQIKEAQKHFPEPGSDVAGFHLLSELGRGAFARVYLARQGDLGNRLVALKVSPDTFFGEALTLAQLQHSNIVPVYSAHRAPPFVLLCMPYCGAVTLADVLKGVRAQQTLPTSGRELVNTLMRGRSDTWHTPAAPAPRSALAPAEEAPVLPADPAEEAARTAAAMATRKLLGEMTYVEAVLWIGSRMAEGLAHAHARGILHRDLKPANVLLSAEGQPMLLDFNLAEDVWGRFPAVARVGGTLPYMAPEQIDALRGAPSSLDERCDVFSLGVILYELLTGRPPFPVRPGLPETIDQIREERRRPPAPPSHWNPLVTPAVDALVRRCLEAEPARRYPSARQLQEDLQCQLAHRPLRHTPEPSGRERLRKWSRRHPRLSSAGTVAAAAALTVFLLFGLIWARGRKLVRLEALDAMHALRRDLEVIPYLLGGAETEPRQREDGLALCRAQAERYQLLDDSDVARGALVRALGDEERRQVRNDLGDLLWCWARALSAEADADSARREEDLRLAVRLNSRAESCYEAGARPVALLEQRARLEEQAGRPAEAERFRKQAAAAPARSARERYLELSGRKGRGGLREALTFLREATRENPRSGPTWLILGNCYAELGKTTEAAGCYDLGVELQPKFSWAWFNRGLLRLEAKDYTGAEADFDEVLRLRPGLVEALMNRAVARLGRNDPQGAVADLTLALEQEETPPYTRIFFMRERARLAAGDKEGAARDRAEGLKREPTDEKSWLARGENRLPQDPTGALADFEEALKVNPSSRTGLQDKAHVLAEYLHKTEEAVGVLTRALELYPEDVAALAGRGVLLARLGKREEARRDAENVLALDRRPATLYQVAGVYALTSPGHEQDRARALDLLRSALRQEEDWLDVVPRDPDLDLIRRDPEFQEIVRAAVALHRGKNRIK